MEAWSTVIDLIAATAAAGLVAGALSIGKYAPARVSSDGLAFEMHMATPLLFGLGTLVGSGAAVVSFGAIGPAIGLGLWVFVVAAFLIPTRFERTWFTLEGLRRRRVLGRERQLDWNEVDSVWCSTWLQLIRVRGARRTFWLSTNYRGTQELVALLVERAPQGAISRKMMARLDKGVA